MMGGALYAAIYRTGHATADMLTADCYPMNDVFYAGMAPILFPTRERTEEDGYAYAVARTYMAYFDIIERAKRTSEFDMMNLRGKLEAILRRCGGIIDNMLFDERIRA